MKQINLDDLIEGETYYIQVVNYKFKAVFDRYSKQKFHFKKIIRLNTPKDWCGFIEICINKWHLYKYFNIIL